MTARWFEIQLARVIEQIIECYYAYVTRQLKRLCVHINVLAIAQLVERGTVMRKL